MGERLRSFERAAGKEWSLNFDGMELAQGSKCTKRLFPKIWATNEVLVW